VEDRDVPARSFWVGGDAGQVGEDGEERREDGELTRTTAELRVSSSPSSCCICREKKGPVQQISKPIIQRSGTHQDRKIHRCFGCSTKVGGDGTERKTVEGVEGLVQLYNLHVGSVFESECLCYVIGGESWIHFFGRREGRRGESWRKERRVSKVELQRRASFLPSDPFFLDKSRLPSVRWLNLSPISSPKD